MFKYTIAVAVLAVSASLAVNVSTPSADNARRGPTAAVAGSAMTGLKTGRRAEKTVASPPDAHQDSSSPSDHLIAAGVLGLLETVSVSKPLLGAAIGHVVRKLKSVDLKRLWKSAVFGALVTALGVAAAAVAVAGLVSAVSVICALLPLANKHLYGHEHPPHADFAGDFVLDAFGKYGKHH